MKITSLLYVAFVIRSGISVLAQPQEAWVARYNGGFVTKSNLPVAMRIDGAGNVVVAGSGQNAGGDFDYVVLKHAPDGTQLFATRHNSLGGVSDVAKGFAMDPAGNSYGVASQHSTLLMNKRLFRCEISRMARPLRLQIPGGSVHVTFHGNQPRHLFVCVSPSAGAASR